MQRILPWMLLLALSAGVGLAAAQNADDHRGGWETGAADPQNR